MSVTLYTIGYEGTDIGSFIAALRASGVSAIADVRAVALSRKPGFSKHKLRENLGSADIKYNHFVELGDPKPGREAARAGRFGEFRRIYAAHLRTLPAKSALLQLADFAAAQPTCLLCFERDPLVCHRTVLAATMVSSGFETENLFAVSVSRHERDIAKGARRNTGQGFTAPQLSAW